VFKCRVVNREITVSYEAISYRANILFVTGFEIIDFVATDFVTKSRVRN